MKNLPLVIPLVLSICIVLTGHSQQIAFNTAPFKASVKCTYRFTYQPDSLNEMSTVSEAAFLFIGNRESEYTTKKNLQMDSTQRVVLARMSINRGAPLSMAGLPVTSINYRIYKKHDTNTITTIDKIDIERFRYSELASAMIWQILPERQTVSGYACQKALVNYAGRTYEAWFTNELPISDGPYKFSGLPGLIVKITDTRGYYSFELLSLQKLTSQLIVPGFMGNVRETSRAEFRQAWLNHRANPFAVLVQEGIAVTEEEQNRYRDKLKRRNNPLELR